MPTRPWFVLRGLQQKGPAHLLAVSPESLRGKALSTRFLTGLFIFEK